MPLSITRLTGETVHFVAGDVVVSVTVVAAKNGLMRLAITAPDEVRVWRDEILPAELRGLVKPNGRK